MTAPTMERRFVATELEIRSEGGKPTTLEGYAAKFGTRSQDLGGFVEQIQDGAFTKTVKEADVRAYFNHDRNLPLGRTKSGTLRLSEDRTGLYYSVDLPDTSYAHDLSESIARGDVTQSSFGFRAIQQDWQVTERNQSLRVLQEVRLFDVSPVSEPAYLDTEGLALRAYEAIAVRLDTSVQEVTEAAQAGHLSELLTQDQLEHDSSSSDNDNETQPEPTTELDEAADEIAKALVAKKLDLLARKSIRF